MFGGERPPEALERYTGFLLNWIATRSRGRFAAALGELGLHLREFAALSMVADRPGLTQHEIVQATAIDASTLVATLDGLERRGLAERRVHPEDRRKRTIHLTPEGETTLAGARELSRELGEELLAPLSATERRQFEALVRKVAGLAPGETA
jgi:DNA-binding MarR family transcriptional regulator